MKRTSHYYSRKPKCIHVLQIFYLNCAIHKHSLRDACPNSKIVLNYRTLSQLLYRYIQEKVNAVAVLRDTMRTRPRRIAHINKTGLCREETTRVFVIYLPDNYSIHLISSIRRVKLESLQFYCNTIL